jgi:hypothetical protein
MGHLTVKEASRILGVKPHTLRAFIRELKERKPDTYSTHILTHTHKFNRNLESYTLTEDFVKELKTHFSTHFSTYFSTHFDRPGGPVAGAEPETTRNEPLHQDILSGVINTLRGEIERQGDVIKQVLQDTAKEREAYAKERERNDIILMQLRADIMKLLPEKKEQAEPPEEQKDQEKPKQDTPEKPEEYKFTFADKMYFLKEDIKRILNKKIF